MGSRSEKRKGIRGSSSLLSCTRRSAWPVVTGPSEIPGSLPEVTVSALRDNSVGWPCPDVSVRAQAQSDRHEHGKLRYLTRVLITVGVAFSQALAGSTTPVKEVVRRVLLFNDFGSLSSPGIAALDQAIVIGLQKSPYQIELYQETLEATLFPDPTSQQRFREWYVRKYAERKPDVIVAVGPASLRFLIEVHEKSFPNIPIIFCGTTQEMLERLKLDSDFTGVWAVPQPEKTLDAALRLQPDTKHIVVVGGVGAFDRDIEATVKQSLHNYDSKFDITYLTDLDRATLLEKLKRLPSKSLVFHTSIMEDAAGEHFIDATQSAPMVASAANAPVFIVDDVDLGTGAVGGDLVSWSSIGQQTAAIVVRVLDGTKPQDIPITNGGNVYMFDWRALHRFGLSEKDLPPGSVVLNRELGAWEYKWYILAAISLILLQMLLILGLLWQWRRRRKAETEVRESEQRFRLVANTAPVMIWMSTPDKLRDYFNRPWLQFTGRSLEAEIADGWTEGVHPEDLSSYRQIYNQSFDRRESYQMQYRLRRYDEEYRWVLDIGVPRFSPNGAFAGYIGSCIDITERRLAEQALASIGRRLIDAHEEERRWIARELHDDVNQRIALVAVELDQWSHHLTDTGGSIRDGLARVRHRLTDIAKDVQALSHRLHSSKLDLLGITAAAKSFCRELAEQHNVTIEFNHANVPDMVPGEISLCLFRVLQEALQNAVKHSGAHHFKVDLSGKANELHLTVSDPGVGFDWQETTERQGLGLISMQERVKLVGGAIQITSKPKAGTEVKVWVPTVTKADSHSDGYDYRRRDAV